MVFARLTHYAFDAVLVSAFLAGVKRSTGLTYILLPLTQNIASKEKMANFFIPRGIFDSPSLDSDKITDNKDFKKWIDNYLGVGEWVMDQSVAVLGSSGWFERRR